MPIIEHVLRQDCDLVFFKKHEKGGHFAALECPQELWADVQEWSGKAWKV
jgi:microsomal epoxide hydrolase